MLYKFGTIEDLVIWMEKQAKHARTSANGESPRAHAHTRWLANAEALERICAVIRQSNVTVLSDADAAIIAKERIHAGQ